VVLKLDAIQGIGDAYAEKLRNAGCDTCEALLVTGRTRKADPSSSQVQGWIDQADKLPPMVET